jgi:O-antigen/teichoic acid export membrane protein
MTRDPYVARARSHPSQRAAGATRERPAPVAGNGAGPPGGRGGGVVSDLRKGSTLNLASSAASALATTGVTVLVARAFGKAEAGAFFTATSAFIIIGAIAGLGTNVGLTYYIARYRSLGEDRRIPALMRVAIIPVIVASIATAVFMFAVAVPLAHLVLKGHAAHSGDSPTVVADALRGLALALPFAGLLNAYLGASRGYGDMRPTALVGQVGLPVGKLLGVVAAVAAGSVALLAPLWAVSYVPMAFAAWLWGRRIGRNRARRPVSLPDVPPEIAALLALSTPVPPVNRHRQPARDSSMPGSRISQRQESKANGRGFWRFTTPRAIANVAQNILQSVDVVLVAIILGPVQAAVYTAATRFLVIGQLGGTAVSRASQARFTELFTLGDRRGANNIYQTTTAWLVLLLWPVFLLSIAYGPLVLEVFGRSYRAGYGVMVILGFSMLLATVCGQVDMVLITSGRSSWSLANGLLTVGVNVGLDLILIPRYGILGAAIGWAVAIAVSNLMPLTQLAAVLRLHPFGRGTILACALSVLSFGVIPLALRAVLGHGVVSLAAAVAAGSVVFLIGLWRFHRALHLPTLRRRPGGRPAAATASR